MDRYHKVQKPREERSIGEHEIRITSQGRMRNYISYAMNLLQEKGSDEIVFKAMGRAINKTVTIVELIKRRIVGLHQIIAIQSIDIIDTWEPLEEGLQTLETTRKVSMVTITLSKKQLDKENIGYQQPIPIDQVKVSTELDYDGDGSPHARGRGQIARGRGRPRTPRGNGFASVEYNDGGYEQNHGYSMGRGRGRARNFRGRGRGGYNGPQVDTQDDSGDYYQDAHRGNGFASVEYNDGGYEQNHGYSMGRGRGRARNFRGRGRGGYNGPQVDTQYDSGDYYQDAHGGNDFASVEYNDGGYEQNQGYSMGRGRGRARNFRGRGRGGYNGPQVDTQYDSRDYYQDAHRGNDFASVEYNDGGYEQNQGYSMGRGRGRARNFRGRGRGGYNGPQVDTQYDSGDYYQDAHRGRGRGRGTRGRGGGFRSNGPVHTTA